MQVWDRQPDPTVLIASPSEMASTEKVVEELTGWLTEAGLTENQYKLIGAATALARHSSYRCSATVMPRNAKSEQLDVHSGVTDRTGDNLKQMQRLVDGQRYMWDWTSLPVRSGR
eukprot:3124300-Pyramimonas_sp.AAC.1